MERTCCPECVVNRVTALCVREDKAWIEFRMGCKSVKRLTAPRRTQMYNNLVALESWFQLAVTADNQP